MYAPEDLPCADFGLLGPLKRSGEYASLRKRVANPKPIDAWQDNTEHFFVFELRPIENATGRASFALFKMRWENDGPVLAVTVTPIADGKQAEVRSIAQPSNVHLVPLE